MSLNGTKVKANASKHREGQHFFRQFVVYVHARFNPLVKLIVDNSRMGSLYFKLRKFNLIQLLLMRVMVVDEGPLQDAPG